MFWQTLINYKFNEKELLRWLKETEKELQSIVPLKESDALIGLEEFDINVKELMIRYQHYWIG